MFGYVFQEEDIKYDDISRPLDEACIVMIQLKYYFFVFHLKYPTYVFILQFNLFFFNSFADCD